MTDDEPIPPSESIEVMLEKGEYARALARLEGQGDGQSAGALFLYRRGYCLLHLGRYAEAQEALRGARARDEAGELRFRISVALANLLLRTGRYGDAAQMLRDLLARAEHSAEEEALLHYSLGQAEFYLGEFKSAIASFGKVLSHYRKVSNPRGIVSTLQSLAAAHQLRHEPDPAIEAYLEAYRIAQGEGDSQSVGLIYLNLGALYLDRAHYANALQYFRDALAIMRELGRVPYEVSLLCNLGNLSVRMGLFEEAAGYFGEADRLTTEKSELRNYRGYLHVYRAELRREEGDWERAREDLDRAQEIFSTLKNPNDLELVAEERLELACLEPDPPAARKALSTVSGLLPGDSGYPAHKRALLEGKASLVLGDGPLSKRLEKGLDRAITFFRQTGYLSFLWEAYSLRGRLLLAAGDREGAREALLRAHDAHQEIRRTLPATAQSSYEKRQGVRAFERACANAALDKNSFVLLKILEFNKKLNEGFGERGAGDFLSDILDEAIALVHADEGYLFLGEQVQAARSAERQGLDAGQAPPHERYLRTLLQEVRRTGKPALAFASAADTELAAFLKELEVVSLLVVPIRARGEVLGTIYLHNRHNRGAFTQENLFLIEAFCDQAGLAILNSRRLEQALDHEARLSEEVEYLKREISGSRQLVLGGSRAYQKVLRMTRQVARSDAGVLLRGETGTGKELLAQEIHALSARSGGPYVRLNVPAIPANLLESELFGHEPGAFTGARGEKRGLFEIASGGTILLDEIGDLPPPSQVKLLRVLQERRLTRLGGTREIPVDVRVVAATNRNLEALLEQKLFREDLFYRLNVVTIEVPALRERPEDILPLAEHFLSLYARRVGKSFTALSARAKEALLAYSWPGNIRELENLIQRAVLLEDGPVLELADAGGLYLGAEERPRARSFKSRVQGAQAEAIREALAATSGNKKQAARMLGLSRSRFYELLGELGVG